MASADDLQPDSSGPTRRAALASLGAAGLAVIAAACSGNGLRSSGTTTTAPRSTTTAPSTSTTTSIPGTTEPGTSNGNGAGAAPSTTLAPDCVLSPEMTEGPYYLDVDLVRSAIAEGRPGAPLTVALTIVDVDGCTPISNATVDVWHADASGEYSGVSGAGDTTRFCRGTQSTDAQGLSRFTTIYPGWYSGRAVHIHVKVHVEGNVVHTGQLFFPDQLNAEVATRPAYSTRGAPDTTNETDSIYAGGGTASTLAPTAQVDGFTAAMTLGVHQNSAAAASTMSTQR